MQPDPITLSIDEANDSTLVVHTLSREGQGTSNRSVYLDGDHTVASRNMLTMLRTLPKKSGNFYGTLKTSVKFTKDVTVPGVDGSDLSIPSIAEASFSFPVGVDEAHCTLMRQSLVALLDADTIMDPLHNQGLV